MALMGAYDEETFDLPSINRITIAVAWIGEILAMACMTSSSLSWSMGSSSPRQ
jgi:hypothetical protein